MWEPWHEGDVRPQRLVPRKGKHGSLSSSGSLSMPTACRQEPPLPHFLVACGCGFAEILPCFSLFCIVKCLIFLTGLWVRRNSSKSFLYPYLLTLYFSPSDFQIISASRVPAALSFSFNISIIMVETG